MFVSGGADYAPLGVRSSLLRATRTPFMEFGARRALLRRSGHRVALLGVYGYSAGGDLTAHIGHLAARYEWRFRPATLSAQAGYQQVHGLVGIPGHREAGARPVFGHGRPPRSAVLCHADEPMTAGLRHGWAVGAGGPVVERQPDESGAKAL